MITAKKTGGQVLITATLGNKSATCTFTVGNEGIIYQNEEKLGYCGWPTVAKIYDDKLISVWSLRQTHQDPYGKVVGAISEDNGVTWSEPFTIIDTVLDDRDAGVIFWNNKVIVSTVSVSKHIYLNSGNQEWINYTNAITDEQEAEALGCKYVIGELVNGELTFGEIKKAPAFTPHGMIKLANGALGYVGYDGYDRETGITKTKITFYSSADGETWSKVSEVFGANEFLVDKLNEPNAIVLKNGKMIVAVRSESGGIYIAESIDGGVTFSNKRALLSAAISTPPHLMQMTDGTLVLSYGYRSEPFNIRAIVSKDNGESWSNEIELTSGGVDRDFGYPATIERGNGELLTVYYQKLSADKKNTALKEVMWTIPENLTYGDKAVVTNDVTSAAFALRADAKATTLTVGEDGGENVITYASTASGVWDARAQLSGKMLDLVTANRQLGGKALTLDFKYEGDVSTLQLWYYTPGIAAKTLKELIDDKVATLAYNGYSIGWERVSKGVWYTLYVDLDKFAAKYGEIVYSASGNDCGLQAATISTLKVKGIEFISAAEIPALTEAIDAFQKFQNCTVETDAETGITTYTGLSDDWGSRAQFTMAMFNKCVEYYELTEDYSVSMEFRYTGDVKNMQFWVYTPSGTQAPTLNSLIDAGTAVVVADGYRFSFGELVKDKWYKVYIDIHKFGAIKISDPNIGVQVASQTSIQYKMPEFVKNSDIPVAKEPLIPFEKVSAGVALSTVYRDGAFITSYTGTSSDWDSRIQLTDNAFAKYTENYNAGNAFMTFDIKYVGAVADFQFWKMNASGGYGETPTLSGLISSGVVIVYKNGESCTYKEIVVGEWYTLQFDMSLFGALGTNESNHGFQFGAQTSIEFKNFEFVTK